MRARFAAHMPAAALRVPPVRAPVQALAVRGVQTRAGATVGGAARRAVSRTVMIAATLAGACFGVYLLDSRAGVYRWVFPSLMELVADAESGQKLAIWTLASGLAPRDCGEDDEVLRTELFGHKLTNPIGIAAGFDKQGEAIDGLFDLGFSMVEIGSVTPEPQPGNDKPRMFRLPLDEAVINRMGFNSEGQEAVRERLFERMRRWTVRVFSAGRGIVSDVGTQGKYDPTALATAQMFAGYPEPTPELMDEAGVPRSLKRDRLLSINLGKNKASQADSPADYVRGVHMLGPYADMLVINVSSPNTPGLRRMQRRSVLEDLLVHVVRARDELVATRRTLPVLVKIAPDLSESELHDVSDAAEHAHIDGIIVSNTTIARPAALLSREHVHEAGGLSGAPLKPRALEALSTIYARTQGRIPLIGCGGIASADDALDFARAGASAVQLYTALAYRGPGLPRRIKDDLAARLRAEGTTWAEVVGTGVERMPKYEPDALRGIGLYPGAQDAFDRGVVSVRNDLEQLRHVSVPGERRALPFHVDKDDREYIELLDEVHHTLDKQPHFHQDGTEPHAVVLPQRASSVPEGILSSAYERHETQGEVLHDAVEAAKADPPVGLQAEPAPSAAQSKTAESVGGLEAPVDTETLAKLHDPVRANEAAHGRRGL